MASPQTPRVDGCWAGGGLDISTSTTQTLLAEGLKAIMAKLR
ncbi:hypothetical protein [Synechococcus sp. UW140]|nr:hypothetical protein [Synechococcus sp. UW140]